MNFAKKQSFRFKNLSRVFSYTQFHPHNIAITNFFPLLQLLNKRIENFISSYKNSTISYPDTKPFIDGELTKLQRRWDEFRDHSSKLKNSLSLAQQYFSLLETVSSFSFYFYTASDVTSVDVELVALWITSDMSR